jgi:hypothetical protein
MTDAAMTPETDKTHRVTRDDGLAISQRPGCTRVRNGPFHKPPSPIFLNEIEESRHTYDRENPLPVSMPKNE